MPPNRVKFDTLQLPAGYQLRKTDQMNASGLDLSVHRLDICRRIGQSPFTLLATQNIVLLPTSKLIFQC
jgi:hypothetical protein